jgi:NADH dehydrogenase FAD-containing subunit
VILDGGFAGMTTAAKLERALGADRSIDITLVSNTNVLLFTPTLDSDPAPERCPAQPTSSRTKTESSARAWIGTGTTSG